MPAKEKINFRPKSQAKHKTSAPYSPHALPSTPLAPHLIEFIHANRLHPQTITPSLDRPVYLAGLRQNRRAETIHDDLYVRALALSDSNQTLVLCALDLIGFFRSDALEVISKTLKVSETFRVSGDLEIIIASTFTHHGPDTIGLWGPNMNTSGVDPAYMAGLKEKIVEVIPFCVLRSKT